MLLQQIVFSLSITVISWMVGMVFNVGLKHTPYYERCSHLNFIRNKSIQHALKLSWFKWVVKKTFFKYFNPGLTVQGKADISELKALRDKMTFAELNHLVGFMFVSLFVIAKLVDGLVAFAIIMMIANILLNLYPTLLQQQNKTRIDKLITRYC